ncbi:MAG: hypothetical protein OET44_21165 [Gammaproteobacteria bacterium]|nr:hypothetical protein [Gammaproteobacteria bacterium]
MHCKEIKGYLLAGLLCAGALVVYGCAEEETGSGAAQALNYNGPGSKWDVSLADSGFTITMRETVDGPVALTVEGTYERMASGFLVLTVSGSEGEGGPDAGAQAWAVEVPGYALILKPMDAGSDQVIPMVVAGNCPADDVLANWVMVKKANTAAADDADREFFGTFAYSTDTNTATLPMRRALANAFQDAGAQALAGGACESGIMTVEDAVMYLTSNGGAIVHTEVNNPDDGSFIFALSQKAIGAVGNLDADYAGVLFDDSMTEGQKIQPVALSCAAGACTGTIVTDVTTGATSAESVTVTLDGDPDAFGNGLITGTIASGADTGNLACMADTGVLDSGRIMVSCIGQSPGDNSNMFNVLFTSIAGE